MSDKKVAVMSRRLTTMSQKLDEESNEIKRPNKIRNLIAFWILGLCNNYGYVVMLSAAHDIVKMRFGANDDASHKVNVTNGTDELHRACNTMSTGAILLADVLPSVIVKFIFPFVPFFLHTRVLICIALQATGFLLVALGTSSFLTLLGIVLTSASSGIGELTILSYCNRFNKHVISSWSSGTGGAGVIGAISYAGLKNWLTTKDTILLMLIIPALEGIAFWIILEHPKNPATPVKNGIGSQEPMVEGPEKTILEKLRMVPMLMQFMIPLGLVYLFEYFINQGLLELIEFRNISWLPHDQQYRWLQVDYQIGVFLSRSSAVLFTFDKIWLMSVLQLVNVVIVLFESMFYFIPSIWIVFTIVFWEGLLGGGAYVNTFYKITKRLPSEDREPAFSIVVLADAIGIAIAGWIAMPVHNAICELPRPTRE